MSYRGGGNDGIVPLHKMADEQRTFGGLFKHRRNLYWQIVIFVNAKI